MNKDLVFDWYPNAVVIVAGAKINSKTVIYLQFNEITGFNIAYPETWVFREPTVLPRFKTEKEAKLFLYQLLEKGDVVSIQDEIVNITTHWDETRPYTEIIEEHRSYLDYIKNVPVHNKCISVYPPFRLGIVGWLGNYYSHKLLADQIERMGVQVVRIAADLADPNKDHPIERADLILRDVLTKQQYNQQELVYMKPLLDPLKIDALLLIQHNMLNLDYRDVDCPIYYYASEIVWIDWPLNALCRGFFYAFYGARALYKNHHSYFYNRTKFQDLIPYAWDHFLHPTPQLNIPRPIFFGFKGSVGSGIQKDESDCDYTQQHIRDLRFRFVTYAKSKLGLIVEEKGNQSDYHRFMITCSLALNVPGHVGHINQRQYDAMGMGCVLVQYHYPRIEELGFIDRFNCLLFKDEESLANQIKWAKQNPDLIEKIRAKGVQFAQLHRYEQRARLLLQRIATKDGLTWRIP